MKPVITLLAVMVVSTAAWGQGMLITISDGPAAAPATAPAASAPAIVPATRPVAAPASAPATAPAVAADPKPVNAQAQVQGRQVTVKAVFVGGGANINGQIIVGGAGGGNMRVFVGGNGGNVVVNSGGDDPNAAPTPAPAGSGKPAMMPADLDKSFDLTAADADKIAGLVKDLASDEYQARQQAKAQLKAMILRPGVAQLLQTQREKVTDPQAKADLAELLSSCGRPLAMIWATGTNIQTNGGFKQSGRDIGYPWLFVRGDGTFFYDAASPIATGKFSDALPDCRQGKLTSGRLMAIQELVGQVSLGNNMDPVANINGVTALFVARSGNSSRSVRPCWQVAAFEKAHDTTTPIQTATDLAVAIRDIVAGSPSSSFTGDWCAQCDYIGTSPDVLKKLPPWPVAEINFVSRTVSGTLSEAQFKSVRGALAKTDTYLIRSPDVAGKVRLVPQVEDARTLYRGTMNR